MIIKILQHDKYKYKMLYEKERGYKKYTIV